MNLKSYIYMCVVQFIHDMWILGRTIAYRFVELNEGRHICYVIVSDSAYLVFTDVNLGTTIMHTDISCDFSQLAWVRYHAPTIVKGGISPCVQPSNHL